MIKRGRPNSTEFPPNQIFTRNNPNPANATVSQIFTPTYIVSDTVKFNNATARSATSASYVKLKETVCAINMEACRFKFDLSNDTDGAGTRGKIYINGTPVGAEHIQGFVGTTTFSDDISGINKGDLIQVYGMWFASAALCTISNFKFCYELTSGETATGGY